MALPIRARRAVAMRWQRRLAARRVAERLAAAGFRLLHRLRPGGLDARHGRRRHFVDGMAVALARASRGEDFGGSSIGAAGSALAAGLARRARWRRAHR